MCPSFFAASPILGMGRDVKLPFCEAWFLYSHKYLTLAQPEPGFGMEPEMRPGLDPGPSSFRRRLDTLEVKDTPTRPAHALASTARDPPAALAPGRG